MRDRDCVRTDGGNPIVFLQGDCRKVLRKIKESSIDSVVTDPPYDLLQTSRRGSGHSNNPDIPAGRHGTKSGGFMGMVWDATGIAFQPEMWQEVLRVFKPGGHLIAMGGTRTHHRLWCAVEDAGFEIRDTLMWLYGQGFPKSLDVSKAIDKAAGVEREVVAESSSGGFKRLMVTNKEAGFRPEDYYPEGNKFRSKEPITDAARQWNGWGTALKPAWEPILLARKPLIGTVAANVLEHGTGVLNIGVCRIGDGDAAGRWPANLVLDEDAAVMLDAQSGESVSRQAPRGFGMGYHKGKGTDTKGRGYNDSGGASRFFLLCKGFP